mmetsp:Transcript_54822/g.88528  ORF Transcript_54822/g.88528 Transcript_54822/m.88528 type:complete len:107 (+) Transcript_54822:483-803(+)
MRTQFPYSKIRFPMSAANSKPDRQRSVAGCTSPQAPCAIRIEVRQLNGIVTGNCRHFAIRSVQPDCYEVGLLDVCYAAGCLLSGLSGHAAAHLRAASTKLRCGTRN